MAVAAGIISALNGWVTTHWEGILSAIGVGILFQQNRIMARQNRIMEREGQVRLHVIPTGVYDLRNQAGAIQGVGVFVRNLSPFPVKIRDAGFRVNGKFLDLGVPENVKPNEGSNYNWKVDIPSRDSRAFYLATDNFPRFIKHYYALDPNKPTQDIGYLFRRWRAYAATECGVICFSNLHKSIPQLLLGLFKQKLRDVWDSLTWRWGGRIMRPSPPDDPKQ